MHEFNRQDYVVPSEIAQTWGVSGETVRRLIRAGRIPALCTPTGRYIVHRSHMALRPTAAR